MSLSFSQRHGFKPVRDAFQVNSMDQDLRVELWNVLLDKHWNRIGWRTSLSDSSPLRTLFIGIWRDHLKLPLDTLPSTTGDVIEILRKLFFEWEWFEVYDFVEFVAGNYPDFWINRSFVDACNAVLEKELSGYRFIGDLITPITSEAEITEIELALMLPDPLVPVTTHLRTALSLFSDRTAPDYRNSIKESISAVEAMCNLVTGDSRATLGQALKLLERSIRLRPALSKAFSSLYGYTSEANGIRHALLDDADLYSEDAKFMLVSCAAFVNYLVAKVSRAGNGL